MKAVVLVVASGLMAPGLVALSAPVASAATCGKGIRSDVNGDGHADAIVGEPGAHKSAGAVRVLYGTPAGLGAAAPSAAKPGAANSAGTPDDQVLTQDTAEVPGERRAGARFGSALTTADFNSDGCADVAVGSPGENRNRGAVTILFGSPAGLTGKKAQRFVPGTDGVPAVVRAGIFGAALAAGDFDGDGDPDLAVGAPDDGLSGKGYERGSVIVLSGTGAGLTSASANKLSAAHKTTAAKDGDFFGQALAVGDFDGDKVADLAVGVPGRNDRAGGVLVFPGKSGSPLGTSPAAAFAQDDKTVPGASEPGDLFGVVLAAGDVTGDGRDDLAVSASGEDRGDGGVVLLTGSASGLRGVGGGLWRQGVAGVGGVAGKPHHFGLALAIGRLDGDKYADLVVASEDAAGRVALAGAVTYLRGSAAGLSTEGRGGTRFTQAGVSGLPARDVRFGRTLAVLPVAGGSPATVLVGAPRWTDSAAAPVAGAFFELKPTDDGPVRTGARRWTANTEGVRGDASPYAWLGSALS